MLGFGHFYGNTISIAFYSSSLHSDRFIKPLLKNHSHKSQVNSYKESQINSMARKNARNIFNLLTFDSTTSIHPPPESSASPSLSFFVSCQSKRLNFPKAHRWCTNYVLLFGKVCQCWAPGTPSPPAARVNSSMRKLNITRLHCCCCYYCLGSYFRGIFSCSKQCVYWRKLTRKL